MVAAVLPASSAMAPAITTTGTSPRQHKLRTYVVLTAKTSRGRLASFEETCSSSASTSASTSASSSPATSPLRPTGRKTLAEPHIPDECLAYESYAAVAARFPASSTSASSASWSPTRDLRWSDISRLNLASLVPTQKPLSQKARRRLQRRVRSASGSANDHLECHALELCFEFLGLADLQRASAVCTEFRDVIRGSGRLLVALYAREFRATSTATSATAMTPTPTMMMPRAYATLAFAPALAMLQQRRAMARAAYALATRSQVTPRADGTAEILNNSLLRVLTRGAVDSVRGVDALPVQPCARALGRDVRYFEVALSGCGSVGVVSLSDAATRRAYGYGSDEHVGWSGVACGYHGNDGDVVYNDGTAPHGGEWTPYGPSWGVRDNNNNKDADDAAASQDDEATWSTVGCGLDVAARRVFFTLNGTFLGFAKFAVPEGEYAAAVSLHEFNDRAVLNAGAVPFRFDLEGFCASL